MPATATYKSIKLFLGRKAELLALVPLSGALSYDLLFGWGFDELIWVASIALLTRLYAFARWTRDRHSHQTFWGRIWLWIGARAEYCAVALMTPAFMYDMTGGFGLDEVFWFGATGIAVRLIGFARWARGEDVRDRASPIGTLEPART